MTAPKRLSRNRKFLIGFAFGLALGAITLLAIGALIPDQISPEIASSFFFASTGVNATLLVAMAVTISAILSNTPDQVRRQRMIFFMAQMIVVFFGLVVSGVGILVFNPAMAFNYGEFVTFVNIVFTTWVIGFVLLIAGIWVSMLPDNVVSRS
jgi:hypothetical protein